jgi:parallel beta-helix repeat protein
VANNTCLINDIGIYLHESDFNIVTDNTCNYNNDGISL